MDPFTQRMLERARARQEKIDQRLASSGQVVPKRKPLTENPIVKSSESSPIKAQVVSKTPKALTGSNSPIRSPSNKLVPRNDNSEQRNDVVLTKKEFSSPRRSGDSRGSDVSVEINIVHRNDVQIEVQVEEREVPMNILYDTRCAEAIKESEDDTLSKDKENQNKLNDQPRSALRQNVKSRLDRLGVLYSDKKTLSSPIHRTETEFSSATPPSDLEKVAKLNKPETKRKFGRLAALADQINNWEDDVTHHNYNPEAQKKSDEKPETGNSSQDTSMLDVSIHSLQDITKVIQSTITPSKQVNFKKASEPVKFGQKLGKNIVAALDEAKSPVMKRMAPKLNNDRSSVLSKAAMFESGSPKAKERDPAEMSIRERKALFEKNKGAAIIPKAPFGLAPSTKSLYGDKAESKPMRPVVNNVTTKPVTNSNTQSKEDLNQDNLSQSSFSGGIKDKLVALFSKEQTISESTITNKFKQEREKEMEMLQNRFNKNKPLQPEQQNDSDEEQSDNDPSEKAPLMGSLSNLTPLNNKPEIIANVPKVTFHDNLKSKSETALNNKENLRKDSTDNIIGIQPVKRRSSQDSPIVLSVLDDAKRIKVSNNKKEPNGNGAILKEQSLYPHLSEIETATSSAPEEESSDCGGSSTDNLNKMNKSDNWADTSFGREVLNVVKNNSYKQKFRNSNRSDSSSSIDSEIDDVLDEALDIDDDSEGPTPPKINKKRNSLSSKSFTYKEGSPVKKSEFKSPLKVTCSPSKTADKGNELIHSVSFYRRTQHASSQPTTPMRIVRHGSPEKSEPTPESEVVSNVTTVRMKIKELQNEIVKQQTIISQASQALNLCASTIEFSGSTEQAEGERLLLFATHRRQACLHEVQRLQVEGAGPAAKEGMSTLHIRDLTIPLRRDYIRQLNADGAVGHHAVCLLKCRDRAVATSMQLTKPSLSYLSFPDEIQMDGLISDFKVTVEVYLLQASKEILPHDVKYHINKKSNSKLLTPKSKISELKTPKIQSPAGPLSVRSPQFQLHGYCIFALPQSNRKSFTLNKVPCGSPLEGSLNVEIKAKMRVPPPEPHSAFLTAFDDVSGLGAWHRRWCVLRAPRVSYWKYPDDEKKKMPIGDIDLSAVVSDRVVKAPRDLCARPNTILLETSIPAGLIVPDSGSLVYFRKSDGSVYRRYLLSADTPRDRDEWLDCLNKALEYVRCCGTDEQIH